MTGNKINWQDLAEDLAAKTGLSRKDAEAFVRSFFDTLTKGLVEEKSVKVKALGTFKMVDVQERESVNVNTGERFTISGHTKIGFLPDNTLKELVNKPFADFQTVILNEGTSMEEMNKIDRKYPSAGQEEYSDEQPIEESTPTQQETEATETPAVQPTEEAPLTTPEDTPTPTIMPEEKSEEEATPDHPSSDTQEQTHAEETTQPASATSEVIAEAPLPTEEPTLPNEEEQPTTEEKQSLPTTEDTPQHVDAAQEHPSQAQNTQQNETQIAISQQRAEHNIWRTLCLSLLAILLLIATYTAGYLRVINLSWLCLPPAETIAAQPAGELVPQDTTATQTKSRSEAKAGQSTTDKDSTTQAADTHTQAKDASKPTTEPSAAEPSAPKEEQAQPQPAHLSKEALEKAMRDYPQVPGGKYVITGVLKTRTIKRGDNLYRMARQEYGDKTMVEYIKTLNQFPNPDNIPVDYEVKLPRLQEKSQ